jgi:hypothetical protein
MSIFMVDLEADGPAPGLYSMVSFAAVKVDRSLATRFKAECFPVGEKFDPESLAGCHLTREQTLGFGPPAQAIEDFVKWIELHNEGKIEVVSDNPAFDWSFLNYYLHKFHGSNPLGHSARRLGDFCAGLHGKWQPTTAWKAWVQTEHTHDPLDDALGAAQGLIGLADAMGVELPGVGPKPARALAP